MRIYELYLLTYLRDIFLRDVPIFHKVYSFSLLDYDNYIGLITIVDSFRPSFTLNSEKSHPSCKANKSIVDGRLRH